MLTERTDLWKPENLAAYLEKDRDQTLKNRPRWRRINGKLLPVFAASEANACLRRLCYAYRGDTPAPMDVDGAMRVYDGNPHADSMVHWLTEMGYEVYDREKLLKKLVKGKNGTFAVMGSIDGMIKLPSGPAGIGAIPYILEMKGLSTNTMRRPMEDIVNKSYRYQAQVYMWLSGVRQACFVVKDKNTSRIRFFQLLYNQRVINGMVARWNKVMLALKQGRLLDREFAQDSLECSWCRHNTTCWAKE